MCCRNDPGRVCERVVALAPLMARTWAASVDARSPQAHIALFLTYYRAFDVGYFI